MASGPVVDGQLQMSKVRCLGLTFILIMTSAIMSTPSGHRQPSWPYDTLQGEGVWLKVQLYGNCVLPAGSSFCEQWDVCLLPGHFRKTRN